MNKRYDAKPLHDAEFAKEQIREEDWLYRRRLLQRILLLRLLAAIGVLLLWWYSEPLSIRQLSVLGALMAYSVSAKVYVGIYGVGTLVHFLAVLQPFRGDKLFFSAALFDFIALFPFLSYFSIADDWSVIALIFLCSTLLSLMVLTFKQAVVLGGVYVVMIGAVLMIVALASYFDEANLLMLSWQERLQALVRVIVENWNEVLSPLLFALVIGLLMSIVGSLASQARENRITADINQAITLQLQRLNSAVIEDMNSGVLVVSENNLIVTANPRVRDIFQLSEESPLPVMLSDLSPALVKRLSGWRQMQHSDAWEVVLPAGSFTVSINELETVSSSMTLMMLESVEESYQRVRETRLASLGRLTAGIAHEIRNPLGAIQSAAELIAENAEGSEEHRQISFLCEKVRNNSKRINAIISNILNMFSENEVVREPIAINSAVRQIVQGLRGNHELEGCRLAWELNTDNQIFVYFNPGHLLQIVHNLVLNAAKHNPEEGLSICVCTRLSENGRRVFIDIKDNGKGIDDSIRESIFEPFFTTKQGAGLGLFLVREMCLANHAQVLVLPDNQGACFRIATERWRSDMMPSELPTAGNTAAF